MDVIVILHIFWYISGNFNRYMKEATKDQTADRIILMCPLEDKDQDINRLS